MNIHYVECGKIFLMSERGALEYSFLDRSDNKVSTEEVFDFYLMEVAKFGEKPDSESMDDSPLRPVAVAMISWNSQTSLFMQIQERRENEFVSDDISPETQRRFNQARFSFIDTKGIKSHLKNKIALGSCFVYENPKYPGENKLKDYISPQRGKVINFSTENNIINLPLPIGQSEFLKSIVNMLYANSKATQNNEGKILPRNAYPIAIINSKLGLTEKLHIIDAAQYLLYPVLGIITYATDHITNRQVTLNFYNDYTAINYEIAPDRILDEEKINLTYFDDYYANVLLLEPQELYHDTLIHYLRIDLPSRVAIRIFRLIETEYDFSNQEELEIIESHVSIIRDEDLTKIFHKRFQQYKKLQGFIDLLKKIPVNKRKILLQLILSETQKKLNIYYPFHLAAMTGIVEASQDANNIRDLLSEAVTHSSSESLDSIQKNDRKVLYQELISTDYMSSKKRANTEYSPNLSFTQHDRNDNSNQFLLRTLMERKEDSFFEALLVLLHKSIGSGLLHQIKKQLNENWHKWDIQDIHRFWNILPKKTADLFLHLLTYILRNANQHTNLVKYPLIFKGFLIEGRGTLNKNQQQSTFAEKMPPNKSTLIQLLSLLKSTEVVSLLRKICLEISIPVSSENVLFGNWWFKDELVKSENEIFSRDYAELIKYYQPKFLTKPLDVPDEIIYLLSGGKSGNVSVQEYLSLDEDKQQYMHIYTTILSFWAENEHVISKIDITNLISMIDDDTSKNILEQVIRNKNKAQINEVANLEAKDAIAWLEHTKHSRIINAKGEDLLFNSLLIIKNPTIDFIRYILVFDLTIAQTVNTWKDYWFKANEIFTKKWKKHTSTRELFTENYVHILSLLNGPYKINKYHALLKLISIKLSNESLRKEYELIHNNISLQTILDFISENNNLDNRVNQGIISLINDKYSDGEGQRTIKDLETGYIKTLYTYMLNQNGKIMQELHKIIETEYSKRINYNEHVSKPLMQLRNIENVEPPTQPRKPLNSPERKALPAQENIPNNETHYSTLELILFTILGLVIFSIIVLTFIALSESVYNEVWKFFNFISKQ